MLSITKKSLSRIIIVTLVFFQIFLTLALLSDLSGWIYSSIHWGFYFPPYGYYQWIFQDQSAFFISFGFPAFLLGVIAEILINGFLSFRFVIRKIVN